MIYDHFFNVFLDKSTLVNYLKINRKLLPLQNLLGKHNFLIKIMPFLSYKVLI
jgi:hypothetical protein